MDLLDPSREDLKAVGAREACDVRCVELPETAPGPFQQDLRGVSSQLGLTGNPLVTSSPASSTRGHSVRKRPPAASQSKCRLVSSGQGVLILQKKRQKMIKRGHRDHFQGPILMRLPPKSPGRSPNRLSLKTPCVACSGWCMSPMRWITNRNMKLSAKADWLDTKVLMACLKAQTAEGSPIGCCSLTSTWSYRAKRPRNGL